jgi:hypothetical protein
MQIYLSEAQSFLNVIQNIFIKLGLDHTKYKIFVAIANSERAVTFNKTNKPLQKAIRNLRKFWVSGSGRTLVFNTFKVRKIKFFVFMFCYFVGSSGSPDPREKQNSWTYHKYH